MLCAVWFSDLELINNIFIKEWRLEEMEKIDRNLTGAERKAALCQLLDQETQLIGSIGRHKQDADVETKQKTVQAFLDKVRLQKFTVMNACKLTL